MPSLRSVFHCVAKNKENTYFSAEDFKSYVDLFEYEFKKVEIRLMDRNLDQNLKIADFLKGKLMWDFHDKWGKGLSHAIASHMNDLSNPAILNSDLREVRGEMAMMLSNPQIHDDKFLDAYWVSEQYISPFNRAMALSHIINMAITVRHAMFQTRDKVLNGDIFAEVDTMRDNVALFKDITETYCRQFLNMCSDSIQLIHNIIAADNIDDYTKFDHRARQSYATEKLKPKKIAPVTRKQLKSQFFHEYAMTKNSYKKLYKKAYSVNNKLLPYGTSM